MQALTTSTPHVPGMLLLVPSLLALLVGVLHLRELRGARARTATLVAAPLERWWLDDPWLEQHDPLVIDPPSDPWLHGVQVLGDELPLPGYGDARPARCAAAAVDADTYADAAQATSASTTSATNTIASHSIEPRKALRAARRPGVSGPAISGSARASSAPRARSTATSAHIRRSR